MGCRLLHSRRFDHLPHLEAAGRLGCVLWIREDVSKELVVRCHAFLHDDGGWRAPRSFVELLDIPADLASVLAPQMVRFEMVVDDLSAARNDELWARAMSALGRAALFCLKRARQSPDLVAELIPTSASCAQHHGKGQRPAHGTMHHTRRMIDGVPSPTRELSRPGEW